MAGLELRSQAADFWQDRVEAQNILRRIAALKEEIMPWETLDKRIAEASHFLDLAISEGDDSLKEYLRKEADSISQTLSALQVQTLLSGEYDLRDAILAIHAGAGGTDSQDWVEMLLRMYLRWAERRGLNTKVLDTSPGEEAGLKSATAEISGKYAYGYLKVERGVHRLVRLSPFDAAHRRHTSFALVEILPASEQEIEVKIDPEDLRIEAFRSSGPGGQHMQKTASAIRITHLPTGIVVSCQNERSQHQNKQTAMKILRSRLLELEIQKREEEEARLKGTRVSAEWGNQIRSYVLHPYTMVKDHRTGVEEGNAQAVLDGELDEFIEAYLTAKTGEGS